MAPELAMFRKQFSSVRMESFEIAAGYDPELTILLYDWNIRIGAAIWEDLGIVEVLLRSGFDRVLSERFGPAWYNATGVLFQQHYPLRDDAIRQARIDEGLDEDERHEPEPESVIAAMPFGMWRVLVSKTYETRLWPILTKGALATKVHRELFETRVADLNDLRNDIAHHRPIFGWHFDETYTNLKRTASVISPHVQLWITGRSRVPEVLREDPLGRAWEASVNTKVGA